MPKTRARTSCCRARARLGGALAAIVTSLLTLPSLASAITLIDFEGFSHGEVVTGVAGVSIVADNFTRAFDLAVAFDSDIAGLTADPDLQAGAAVWSGGNLKGEHLGKMLILQENSTGCATGVCSSPDDEGRRPAGSLSFLFEVPVVSFGFDLVDIDHLTKEHGSVTFEDVQGFTVSVDFETLLAGLQIGDNTANRIATLDLAELQLAAVSKVTFGLGGSGAIDNVTFQAVPEPTTALLLGIGLAGLGFAGRRVDA